jgi:hypothetical protein
MDTTTLQAGAAQVEITPPAGTHLAGRGDGFHRPAQLVLDPLYAKALVLRCGPRKLCIVALDVTIVTEEWTEKIRQAAQKNWGFEPDAVMVHATQTHSAPPLGHFMFDRDFTGIPPEQEHVAGGETAYYELALPRVIEAIERAVADLRPVQAAAGSAVKDGLAFNRRGVTRDGSIVMPWFFSGLQKPLGPTHIRYIEGPIDPEVGVFCLRDDDLTMRAMILHYTCHPVNLYALPGNTVSADWPGAWSTAMREACGAQCQPVVLNGCCGNINPWPAFEPDFVPDHRRMGAALAERSQAVIRELQFAEIRHLDWRVRRVPLPLRMPPAEELAEAERILAEHPAPAPVKDKPGAVDPQWFRAAALKSIDLARRRGPALPYEIQVFRVGDVALVGLPGEPFVEGQLAIKIASPAPHTFIAHCTTQYVGYIPTAEAQKRGGHEGALSFWAKLAPESLDLIVQNATALLKEMF